MHAPKIPLQLDGSLPPAFLPKPLAGSPFRNGEGKLVYVVDDMLDITELYQALLDSLGCVVKAFNNREEALLAIQTERRLLDLLITDYIGWTMSADQFLVRCRTAHPDLRILMVSGFDKPELQFSNVHPDGFLRKPFTAEEFEAAVRAILTRA
jgi:DNA-binding response OmpR family regulator